MYQFVSGGKVGLTGLDVIREPADPRDLGGLPRGFVNGVGDW